MRSVVTAALAAGALLLGLGACATSGPDQDGAAWTDLLADGGASWRTVGSTTLRPEWSVSDGVLTLSEKGGGDITNGQVYEDFELELDWRISEGGNSGVFYFVDLDHSETKPWQTGPEMQILDNARHKDGGSALTSAGANFGLYPTNPDAVRPAGEWNEARLVARDGKVEHWLNGTRVVSYDMASSDLQQRIQDSKFKRWETSFAKRARGAIVLQDHGDRVDFRNIRIRDLGPRGAKAG